MKIRQLRLLPLAVIIVFALQGCADAPPPAAAPATASKVTASSTSRPTHALVSTPTPSPAPEPVSITAAGSTSVGPVIEALAEMYMEKYPHVAITVEAGGSGVGINSCADGTADIGMASRDLIPEEQDAYPAMRATRLCMDGVAVIVNTQNPVDGLTRQQVKAMYLGNITDWSQAGGIPGQVNLYTRDSATGTREAFQMLFLGKDSNGEWIEIDETICAGLFDGSGAVNVTAVQGDPMGITYMSLGIVPAYEGVKALSIDGIPATRQNVSNGSYPYFRNFNLLTLGPPQGEAAAFMAFCQTDLKAKQYMTEKGYIVP